MNTETIIDFLNKNGLKPATKRNLGLLLFALIAQGYSFGLKRWLGFAYQSLAAIGDKETFHSFLNEEKITLQMNEFLSKQHDLEKTLLNPILDEIEKIKKVLDRAELILNENPWVSLEIIFRIFPEYMSCLGIYNCFMRLVGDGTQANILSNELIKLVSSQRDSVAVFYTRFEKLLYRALEIMSRVENRDLMPLRMLTFTEMRELLMRRSFERIDFDQLKQRETGYYYQFQNKIELVTTDSNTLKDLKDTIFHHESTDEIFGKPVFSGIIRGKIRHKNKAGLINPGEILVCSMTHPDDIQVLKKCGAIITDEGGILSHAAIIARELKKPCIIGTKIATSVLRDGDEVEVDAIKGIVKIIK